MYVDLKLAEVNGLAGFEVNILPTEFSHIGTYKVFLEFGLVDHSQTVKDQVNFDIIVNPCVITAIQTPSDIDVIYNIPSPMKQIFFNFNQVPDCGYNATYTSVQKNGTATPDFIELASDRGYLTVYTKQPDYEDDYTVRISA